MSRLAEDPLFLGPRRSSHTVGTSLAVAAVALCINAGFASASVSLLCAAFGAGLLLSSQRGHRRGRKRALVWLLPAAALFVGVSGALGSQTQDLGRVGARILCGLVWVLWLGTIIDWTALKRLILRAGVPPAIVTTLDRAVLHGVFTQREWLLRRDAARLRIGRARLPLSAWGSVLGEGALSAFTRMERSEEASLARSARARPQREGRLVHLEAVDVERNGSPVLRDLSFTLRAGEWIALCGPSGAGKSTLLRLLGGLEGPASGHLEILGRRLSPRASVRQRLDGRIALLCQHPEHHFLASTVAEDIAWGLEQRNVGPTTPERVREIAEALGVSHLLERACHQLSFGEQKRVALAGLLVLEPELLLLDEPTAGLDPVAAHHLTGHVRHYVERTGATCIWATHDLDALPPQVERVVLLDQESIVFDGPAIEGLSQPWRLRCGLAVQPPSPPLSPTGVIHESIQQNTRHHSDRLPRLGEDNAAQPDPQ